MEQRQQAQNGQGREKRIVEYLKDAVRQRFVVHVLSPFLENPVPGEFVSKTVRDDNQNEADHRFKQIDRRTEAELAAEQAFPIDERVDNVALLIDEWIIQVEHLVEVRVQYIAKCQRRHDNRNRDERRDRYMQRLLPSAGTVNLGCFVQCRIDTGKRSEENDRIEAEFLPHVADDNREPEPIAVTQK